MSGTRPMGKPIAIAAIRTLVDPADALATAEARLRGATTIGNLDRAAKAMDDACERMLAIAAVTRADYAAQFRALDWQDNRARRVSDAIQHIEDMDAYRNRRVGADRPYARKAR